MVHVRMLFLRRNNTKEGRCIGANARPSFTLDHLESALNKHLSFVLWRGLIPTLAYDLNHRIGKRGYAVAKVIYLQPID
jgi:hypothetical protein